MNADHMIGKHVRVTGTIAAAPTLDQGSGRPATTAGELIDIKAAALSVVNEVCGGGGAEGRPQPRP